jgi:putative hydrolase of HD superfamily
MPASFESLLNFVSLLHQYRTIERRVLIKGSDRSENDVEHSFNLAMLAWYIQSTYALDLDLEKLLMYSLAHDFVEVHAGDTYFYQNDKDVNDKKHEKEAKAAQTLRKDFPEFPEFHNAIEQYEKREDKESKFIYALDKIEPVLSIYSDDGRSWKKNKVTLEMLRSMKAAKVSADKTVESIFRELIERLALEEDKLFPKDIY